MSVSSKYHIAALKKSLAAARKRRKRWVTRRNTLLLKWALEGVDIHTSNVPGHLYAWDIKKAEQDIAALTACLEGMDGRPPYDPQ